MKMVLLAGLGAVLTAAAPAWAQDYPARPITIVVAYPAGQASDIGARYIAEQLAEALGQPVVIENRPGSAGNIGTAYAARAEPDGYTLLAGTNGSHAINPFLYEDVGYDPLEDFEPVAGTIMIPMAISANAALGVNSFEELAAAARERPGEIDVALPSVTAHLVLELLRADGIELNGIRYGGAPDAQAAVLGNQVPVLIDTLGASRVHFGRLVPLGVTSPEPATTLPDLRPIAEQGVEGFSVTAWNALYVLKGTPPEIRERLEAEMAEIMAREETAQAIRALGFEMAPQMSREELENWVRQEYEKYGEIIASSGLSVN